MERASAERLAVIEIEGPKFCVAHARTAFASIAWNTGSSSPGDVLMTCSTSAVAVCCSSNSSSQLVEQAGVLDGNDGLRGEVLQQLDLLIGEWADLLAVDSDAADQPVLSEHWNEEQSACARQPH